MKVINVPLSVSGVTKALEELKAYRQKVHNLARDLVTTLCDNGVEIALVESADIDMTGWLRSGIHSERISSTLGAVVCDCGYAVYVEFGTGVKGRSNPHPKPAILGWVYDVNNHGELGWWYPTDKSDTNPTKRVAKDGSMYAWTKGLPSRPFMYTTAEQLRSLIIPETRRLLSSD